MISFMLDANPGDKYIHTEVRVSWYKPHVRTGNAGERTKKKEKKKKKKKKKNKPHHLTHHLIIFIYIHPTYSFLRQISNLLLQ